MKVQQLINELKLLRERSGGEAQVHVVTTDGQGVGTRHEIRDAAIVLDTGQVAIMTVFEEAP